MNLQSRKYPRKAGVIQIGAYAALALVSRGGIAQNTSAELPDGGPAPTHGHSVLGEAFNEGPRQHAYLMKGMGNIDFPITTSKPTAQKFFTQGVAQLHGFWYLEAERSFRQAAVIDPHCAMAYWGIAMANRDNDSYQNKNRAQEFIQKAVDLRAGASLREQMYIDALAEYFKPNTKETDRDKAFLNKLQAIMKSYPEDLEAKAFFGLFNYEFDSTVPIKDYAAADAIFTEVLKKNPMHPLHHYRIHLWNGRDDAKALNSAALCGPSSPGIAHMWHMQGHTYSSLHRYADAAWSQEASARVDHAQMNRNRIMPDQVFNYAHNNQWLVENLGYIGRVHAAVDLARNMVELPRHPEYNTLKIWASATNGRMRLIQTLQEYELWDDALALSRTGYIEPGDRAETQMERLRLMAVAACSKGDISTENEVSASLESMKRRHKFSTDGGEKPLTDTDMMSIESVLTEIRCYDAVGAGNKAVAVKLLTDLGDKLPQERASRLWLLAGNTEKAIEVAKSAVTGRAGQVEPQGNLVDILYRAGKKNDAKTEFKMLREISGSIDSEDLSSVPLFKRLSLAAADMGIPIDWRLPAPILKDIGPRPPLESLGPFRWHPVSASNWSLVNASGKRFSLADYTSKGHPVLVVLYLGSTCTSCVEQLNTLAPMAKQFENAGISIVAIGVDQRRDLTHTLTQCKAPGGFPFPVLSDNDMRVFKAYRAYDDFEKMPLHGMYLVDAKGLIRWQDVSFKPFMDMNFVLTESKRLLQLPEIAQTGVEDPMPERDDDPNVAAL